MSIAPARTMGRSTGSSPRTRRRAGLAVSWSGLAVLLLLSLAVGSRQIPLAETVNAFVAYDPGNDLHLIVRELRVPRTIIAVLVGAALGVSGALMQAMTRNALAEPGVLGVNAGAAAAIVLGVSAFGLNGIGGYVWFGYLGAGLAAVAVLALGRAHDAGTNPVRLVLAGAGLSVMLAALTSIVIINSPDRALDAFRAWATGSLQGRGMDAVPVVAASIVVGVVLALAVAPSLNAVALGSDMSTALGLNGRRTWVLASVAVLLLAGSATAAAGPIAFVGLAAPHMARLVVGPDQRRVLPWSALFAVIVLLGADVLGRLVAHPSEIGAGVMSAVIGGPFFIALVRRRRFAQL